MIEMAPTPAAAVAAAGLLALFVWWAIGRILPKLREIALDRPNARSSHSQPTPRGGGLPLVGGFLLVLALWGLVFGSTGLPGLWTVLAGAVLLAMVSWRDDQESLPAGLRFSVQLAAVLLAIGGMVGAQPATQGLLPLWADLVFTALLWIWFINLFNFMDGIDGLSAVEALSISLGVVVLALLGDWPLATVVLALLLIGAVAGFLPWNWHRAQVFLGDVGSVPLGFLLGWLLVIAAGEGAWASALILPAYYWADATTTLLLRLMQGQPPWRAHRSHAYQRAVERKLTHGSCSLAIGGFNLLLLALAVAAELWQPWVPLAVAALLTGAFLIWLRGGVARAPDSV
ncbi:MraY family glycosyltransferase [Algihabitans albus]|uniref:MraY family glycosyltransferase n=1 Tax=Algihabitans albus TaxID=2164067 RepID=UPI000E5C9E46|nr:glycosyltransferase family 4 protein [Algihabitans albus]